MGTFGEWGAYADPGQVENLLRPRPAQDPGAGLAEARPAYIFISTRPAENVKNEISFIMGFPMKDGGEAQAEIGDVDFGLIAKGSNAWVKNPAEEGHLIDAMKKGSKLVVKAASTKGKVTTDTYSLWRPRPGAGKSAQGMPIGLHRFRWPNFVRHVSA